MQININDVAPIFQEIYSNDPWIAINPSKPNLTGLQNKIPHPFPYLHKQKHKCLGQNSIF